MTQMGIGELAGRKLTTLSGGQRQKAYIAMALAQDCPICILEAQAMGVPVVTMNSGGMAELVKDGVTGALIETSSPEGIAEKLYETLKDEASYSVLRENCRNEKDNILSVETYADILLETYKKLVTG